MAKLEPSTGGSGSGLDIQQLAPQGQYLAVCLRVTDLFQVERTKFQSEEKELQDVTRFLFGLIDQQGTPYLIQTYEYRISGANNSNLVKFLTQWLGRPPEMGWDYCELQGQGAMVSVAHQQSKGTPPKTYAKITGISPVFEQLRAQLPSTSYFDQLITQAEQATQAAAQNRAAQQQGQAPAQTPPYQQGGYTPPAAAPAAPPANQGFHQPPTSHPPAAPQQIVPPAAPPTPPANAGFPPQHAAPPAPAGPATPQSAGSPVPPQPPTAAGAGFPPQPPSQGDVIEDTPF